MQTWYLFLKLFNINRTHNLTTVHNASANKNGHNECTVHVSIYVQVIVRSFNSSWFNNMS